MRSIKERIRLADGPREKLRDPALWLWLIVALLAILPARAALVGG
jgi:hypothetical protein